jgi:transposase
VLEDLHVSGMVQNHHLAQAIADVGFYEFRRQMVYKGQWYGCQVLLANRFYPSSKRCSQCGHIQATLDLSTRVYTCEHCGLMIDRDLNAALNLELLTTGSSQEPNSNLPMCRFVQVSENGECMRLLTLPDSTPVLWPPHTLQCKRLMILLIGSLRLPS